MCTPKWVSFKNRMSHLCSNKGVVKQNGAGGANNPEPESTDGAGTPVEALYTYTASPDLPFLPDPRKELDMKRGDVFYLIHKRTEDGWCLVTTSPSSSRGAEGWVSCLYTYIYTCMYVYIFMYIYLYVCV